MSSVTDRDFGRMEATVSKLEDQVEKLTLAVERLASTVEQSKGGLRVIIAVGAVSSTVTAIAIKMLGLFKGV